MGTVKRAEYVAVKDMLGQADIDIGEETLVHGEDVYSSYTSKYFKVCALAIVTGRDRGKLIRR